MTLPSEKPATDVAAQCFLNALIRETTDWKLTEYPPDELLIPLDEQKSLHFRVAYFSPTQHHRFAFPARLVTASGSYPVDFTTLSRLIIDKLRHQLFLPVPLCETFHQRVLESPYWNVKGNFFCYLNDHNENTIVDPSVIYFDFANPLQAQEV